MNLGDIAAELGKKLGDMDPAQTTEFVSRVAEKVQPGSGDFVREALSDPKNAPQPKQEKDGPRQEQEEDLTLVQLLIELLKQLLDKGLSNKAEAGSGPSINPMAVLAAAKEVHAEMKAEAKAGLESEADLEAEAVHAVEAEAAVKKEAKAEHGKTAASELEADAELEAEAELGEEADKKASIEHDGVDLTDDEVLDDELDDGYDADDELEEDDELEDSYDTELEEEDDDELEADEEDELSADKGDAKKEAETRDEGVALASTRGTENEVKGVRVVGDGFAQASASMDERSVQYDERVGEQVGGSQALAGTSVDSVPTDELVTEQRDRCKLTERATDGCISRAKMEAAAEFRAEEAAEATAEDREERTAGRSLSG